MTISCVAFDFDDTLVLSEQVKRQTFYDVVDPVWRSALDGILAVRPQLDRHETFERLARSVEAGPDAARSWVDHYSRTVEVRIASCPEVPGATDTLRTLGRRGTTVVIVSDTPEDSLRRVVANRGWSTDVDQVHGRPGTKDAHLRQVAAHLGVASDAVVMVGDRESDLRAALSVGARFIGVRAPVDSRSQADFHDVGKLADHDGSLPYPVVPDLTGIVDVIDDLESR